MTALVVHLSQDLSRLVIQTTDRTVVALPFDPLDKESPRGALSFILRRILLAREIAAHPVISTDAAPTQWQVDQWIKDYISSGGVVTTPKKNAPANISLKDLGL